MCSGANGDLCFHEDGRGSGLDARRLQTRELSLASLEVGTASDGSGHLPLCTWRGDLSPG